MIERRNTRQDSGTYRVRFYRDLVNSSGARSRCTIDTVEISRARSVERALDAAKRRFERNHGLSAWNHLAHGCEAEDGSDTGRCRPKDSPRDSTGRPGQTNS